MYYQRIKLNFGGIKIKIHLKSQNLHEKKELFTIDFTGIARERLESNEVSIFDTAEKICTDLHPYCFKVSIKSGNVKKTFEK